MFSRKRPVFEAFKNKTYLKCSGARIKMIMAKKTNESKVIAREIGELLKGGKEELARIKVEHIIRNKNDIHALEIVQLFCDLLLARHLLLESEQSCPVEMQEAVFSICWAASRTEVPELMQVREQFILKYPLDFGIDPRTGQPLQVLNEGQASQVAQQSSPLREFGVNEKLKDYLSVKIPERRVVLQSLQLIAEVYAKDWTPPDWLVDPPNEHLIDVGNSIQPGEFEPGYVPSAPPEPENGVPVQARVVDASNFDTMFPDVPSGPPAKGGGGPPPKSGGGGNGGGDGSAVPAYLVTPVAPSSSTASPDNPNFDELEARFAALNAAPSVPAAAAHGVPPPKSGGGGGGGVSSADVDAAMMAAAQLPVADAVPLPLAPAAPAAANAGTLDLEARLAALSGGMPAAPAAGAPLEMNTVPPDLFDLPSPPNGGFGVAPGPGGEGGGSGGGGGSDGGGLDDLEARFAALRNGS